MDAFSFAAMAIVVPIVIGILLSYFLIATTFGLSLLISNVEAKGYTGSLFMSASLSLLLAILLFLAYRLLPGAVIWDMLAKRNQRHKQH